MSGQSSPSADTSSTSSGWNGFRPACEIISTPLQDCRTCRRTMVRSKCLSCNILLCDVCDPIHRSLARHNAREPPISMFPMLDPLGNFRDQLIGETSMAMCTAHNEPCKIKCHSCRTIVCASCMLNSHESHDVKYLQVTEYQAARLRVEGEIDNIDFNVGMALHAYVNSLEMLLAKFYETKRHVANQLVEERESPTDQHLFSLIEKVERVFRGRIMEDVLVRDLLSRTKRKLFRLLCTLNTHNDTSSKEYLIANERVRQELEVVKMTIPENLVPAEFNVCFTVICNGVGYKSTDVAIFVPPRNADDSFHPNLGRPILGATRTIIFQPPQYDAPLIIGLNGRKTGQLSRPWGVCCNALGHLIISDRSNNRIQIFDSTSGRLLFKFGAPGTENGKFDLPCGVCVNAKNEIYVCDKGNHRVQKFAMDGTFLMAFGRLGKGPGEFNYPWGIACSADGRIAVTDGRNRRVQLFTSNGHFISVYGDPVVSRNVYLDLPRGVCFTPEGDILATDFNLHRLVKFSPDLGSARVLMDEDRRQNNHQFGGPGPSSHARALRPLNDGNVPRPFNIGVWQDLGGRAVPMEGANLAPQPSRYCNRRGNRRVQCDPNGNFTINKTLQKKELSEEQKRRKRLWRPQGIICDDDGNVLIADKKHHRVQVFNPRGELLKHIGGDRHGDAPGMFNSPAGIALTPCGKLVVVDSENHRVQIFH